MNLRDKMAIEFAQRQLRGNLNENLAEYFKLLDALAFLLEGLKEGKVQVMEWQKSIEALIIKFVFHGFSIHHILSGTKINSQHFPEIKDKVFYDTNSSKTILRTQLETYLMFQHIYVNPINDDLKEMRYWAWKYTALLRRQSYPAKTEFGKQQKALDVKEIEVIKETIVKLKSYQQLSQKQQDALIKTGSGKTFMHWNKIMKESGFGEDHHFQSLYEYLSIYSHTEGLAIIQMENWSVANNTKQANFDIYHSSILTSILIESLVKMFKIVEVKYHTLSTILQYDIEFWQKLANRDAIR